MGRNRRALDREERAGLGPCLTWPTDEAVRSYCAQNDNRARFRAYGQAHNRELQITGPEKARVAVGILEAWEDRWEGPAETKPAGAPQ